MVSGTGRAVGLALGFCSELLRSAGAPGFGLHGDLGQADGR